MVVSSGPVGWLKIGLVVALIATLVMLGWYLVAHITPQVSASATNVTQVVPAVTPIAPAVASAAGSITVTQVVTKLIEVTVTVKPAAEKSVPVGSSYPELTMADVAPLIAKFGTGGNPSHDVAGNLQCAYWLSPKYLLFADDTGPNTSSVETADGVFEFDLESIIRYKMAPTNSVFVIEAAWISYRGQEYESTFLITNDSGKVRVSGAAVFLLPNPRSVDPFVALRQEHLKCRGYQNQVVDDRDGKMIVSTPVAGNAKAPLSPVVTPASPAPVTVVPPTGGGVPAISAAYAFGSIGGSKSISGCIELGGVSKTLRVDLQSGGFATSGRVSDTTDWQIARSSGAGKYNIAAWAGWLLCFAKDAASADALLVSTDANAKNNQRVVWESTK